MFLARLTACLCLGLSLQAATYLTEGFADVSNLPGWVIINNSTPGGQTPEGWFQGSGVFTAPSGAPNSYIQANFENAGSPGDISTWLLTPVLTLEAGSLLEFYTIGENVAGFPDRLEVRLSSSGASTDVGSTPSSVGDFSELLLTVNPALSDGGYPTSWTQFVYSFSDLTAPVTGRIGFRYSVPNRDVNGSTIGIDSVFIIPEPGPGSLVSLGVIIFGSVRFLRKRLKRSLR
jgi:hypothetical protein